MRNNKRDSEGFFSTITGSSPSLSYDYHIEFNDDREVIAEGCLGVMACGEDQIRLNMGSRSLLLTGSDLVIASMYGRTVCVHGRIVSAEFI